MSTLVLAVDFSEILGVCVLVITVLSWFVNVVKGNTPDGVPRATPKPKPKAQTGRSEIEALLQQLSGEKPKPERRESPKPPKPQPQPQPERGRSKPKPTAPSRSSSAGSATSRPFARVSESHLPSSNLGSDVRSHHLGNRVDAEVRHDVSEPVRKDIRAAVQHDLGNRIAPAAAVADKPVHPLVKILRDPDGVRQAIILNEILQRPKSRRHDSNRG
jgi:hypothetical protein